MEEGSVGKEATGLRLLSGSPWLEEKSVHFHKAYQLFFFLFVTLSDFLYICAYPQPRKLNCHMQISACVSFQLSLVKIIAARK